MRDFLCNKNFNLRLLDTLKKNAHNIHYAKPETDCT